MHLPLLASRFHSISELHVLLRTSNITCYWSALILIWRQRQRLLGARRLERWLQLLYWLRLIHVGVALMHLQSAALVHSCQGLRLSGVRSWPHKLVDLVLMRCYWVGVDCVVDVGDVLRTAAQWLVMLTISLILAITLWWVASVIKMAIRLPHHVTLMCSIAIFSSFLRCLGWVLRRSRSRVNVVVVTICIESILIMEQALCLALTSYLWVHTLITCSGWVALALALNLRWKLKRGPVRLWLTCV